MHTLGQNLRKTLPIHMLAAGSYHRRVVAQTAEVVETLLLWFAGKGLHRVVLHSRFASMKVLVHIVVLLTNEPRSASKETRFLRSTAY